MQTSLHNKIKIMLVLCAGLVLVGYQAFAQVYIKGSDTMYPLVSALAEMYQESQQDETLRVEGGGSSSGITTLQKGGASVAMSSRPLTARERGELSKYTLLPVAYDALSVIVHPSNAVQQLNKEQLKGIFTGKITNWKDLGGKDLSIVLCTRLSSSGTYAFMIEHVLDGQAFALDAVGKASNAGIVQSVSENPAAIGYVGLAYVEEVVRPLAISFGGTYVRPTFKNALDGKYPISRELFLLYQKDDSSARRFAEFILKPLGQELVTHKGYIPIKKQP